MTRGTNFPMPYFPWERVWNPPKAKGAHIIFASSHAVLILVPDRGWADEDQSIISSTSDPPSRTGSDYKEKE